VNPGSSVSLGAASRQYVEGGTGVVKQKSAHPESNLSVTSDAALQIFARASIEQPIKRLHTELKHLSAPLAAVTSLPQKKLTASRTSVNRPQVSEHAVTYN